MFGEGMDPAELYDWFGLVRPAREWPVLVLAHCEPAVFELDLSVDFKYEWLRDHRDIQLALALEGLKRKASLPRERPLDPRRCQVPGKPGATGFSPVVFGECRLLSDGIPRVGD